MKPSRHISNLFASLGWIITTFALGASAMRAAITLNANDTFTTSTPATGDLKVTGDVSVWKGLDVGVSATNATLSAIQLDYYNAGALLKTASFDLTDATSTFQWRDNNIGTLRKKMKLDGNNVLYLYNSTGLSTPITLAGSTGAITATSVSITGNLSVNSMSFGNPASVRQSLLMGGGGGSASGIAMSNGYGSGNYSTGMSGGDAGGNYSTAMSGGQAGGNYSTGMSGGQADGNHSTGMSGGYASANGNYSTAMSGGYATGDSFSTAMSGGYATSDYSTAMSGGYATGDSHSTGMSGGYGAAEYSTGISFGWASGYASTGMSSGFAGGIASTALSNGMANADYSTAMSAGTADGQYSLAAGNCTNAASYSCTALGSYNNSWGSADLWVPTDPILLVGNGRGDDSPNWRFNAIATLKNGQTTLTNKEWKLDPAIELTEDNSHGEALVAEGNTRLEGNTVMKGKVTILIPQGDISMGIYE